MQNRVSHFLKPSLLAMLAIASVSAAACSGGPGTSSESDALGETGSALTAEDGLADAYTTFLADFTSPRLGFDKVFPIGFGYHPGLSTQKLVGASGQSPKGQVKIKFALRDAQGNITTPGQIDANVEDIPSGKSFDLWFVKNVAGSGRTVAPETGDVLKKVGSFTGVSSNGGKALSIPVSATQNKDLDIFDLDLVVVTLAGQQPTASRIAVGSRTILEKRFFRNRDLKTGLDPVPAGAQLSSSVESNDPLVRRGAFLFTSETFGGNGRVCSTCHRLENNLTLDPAFIANLPQNDPLFVAENNSHLAQLEDSTLLRTRALNRENLDGFDKQPVLRGIQHTFALATTVGIEQANASFPLSPRDHRLGWSGDGAPGRGTLNEFAFGAIMQHFTKEMTRRPGIDFRVPTQEELDALEAFQLFSGRQKLVDGRPLVLKDARAEAGRQLFMQGAGGGKCTNCHLELGSLDFNNPPFTINFVLATGVRNTTPELPTDDGYLSPRPPLVAGDPPPPLLGDGSFNVQPVIEAADSGHLFHNNKFSTIEDAVHFYTTDDFRHAPNGVDIQLTPTEQDDIADFLRVLNAAENLRQVRKRIQFVHDNRSAGNTDILTVAIADTQDALDDLSQKGISANAQHDLATLKQTLQIAQANADANRPAYIDSAMTWLNLASGELFTSNPNGEF